MRTNPYVKFLNTGREGRAYATIDSPRAILKAILQALEFHGVKREQIEKSVDLEKLEAQFDAIDSMAFRRLLNASDYHFLQLILTESQDRQPPGSMAPPPDRGTIFGPIG